MWFELRDPAASKAREGRLLDVVLPGASSKTESVFEVSSGGTMGATRRSRPEGKGPPTGESLLWKERQKNKRLRR